MSRRYDAGREASDDGKSFSFQTRKRGGSTMKAIIFLLALILLMSIEMNILLFRAYKKLRLTLKNKEKN